ncbi:MAG: phosphoglycerate kinase [bacterium]
MKLIDKEVVKNKRVLLRLDLNVPTDNNLNIMDNTRIIKSIPTIKFLLESNCNIIIMSHMGRVKTEEDIARYSLSNVANELSKVLNEDVELLSYIKKDDLKYLNVKFEDKKIIMLENTRFYDLEDGAEKNCDFELSESLAKLADVFINDAFGASHRRHASTYGVRKYIDSYYGFLINEELSNLEILNKPTDRPFSVFMGGAKVEDKLPIIKKMLLTCDYLCLGGGILNSFLKASGYDVKESLCTTDEDTIRELKELLNIYSSKITLSNDLVWKDDRILDIGVSDYRDVLSNSKLIFINGTPGLFEVEEFKKGTIDLFEILKEVDGKVIVGGGDTVSAVNNLNVENVVDFISSGGGASLEFITDGYLGALE